MAEKGRARQCALILLRGGEDMSVHMSVHMNARVHVGEESRRDGEGQD